MGAGETRAAPLTLDEAFARSRSASIALGVLAVVMATQLGLVIAALPRDVLEKVSNRDPAAIEVVSLIAYTVVFSGVAVVCALFAWLMRSRVAMIVGLVLVALNWLDYALVVAAGEFTLRGVIMNAIVTLFLVRSLPAAFRYHQLKKAQPVDPEVFS